MHEMIAVSLFAVLELLVFVLKQFNESLNKKGLNPAHHITHTSIYH